MATITPTELMEIISFIESSKSPQNNGYAVNNIKMPTFTIQVNGPTSNVTPPTGWTGSTAAYNKLTSTQRTQVATFLAKAQTDIVPYPGQTSTSTTTSAGSTTGQTTTGTTTTTTDATADWKNFVSYMYVTSPSTANSVLTTFSTVWSGMGTTSSDTADTLAPTLLDRVVAVTAYNVYAADTTMTKTNTKPTHKTVVGIDAYCNSDNTATTGGSTVTLGGSTFTYPATA